ncbi:hypothetical protein [Streptomyces sp. NPDC054940]
MAGPHRLRPEDRADFEAVLHLALSTADIRAALLADPTGHAARYLRAHALDAADEITAEAGDAYDTYLAVRSSAPHGPEHPPSKATLLSALSVLTPLVAATSAAILLLLGYVLQLAEISGSLPASLVTAGWVLALIAAVSTLLALTALLRTALQQRHGVPSADRLEQARITWQQALLDRGMLPHLRRRISEDPLLRATLPKPSPAGPDDTVRPIP